MSTSRNLPDDMKVLPSVDALKKVCDESLQRGTKRKIKLVARKTWFPQFMSHREDDGDVYSRNGHPPKKLIMLRSTSRTEVRDWNDTPCRYGKECKAHKRKMCWFKHEYCEDEVEIAAGSSLRCRQIQRDLLNSCKGEVEKTKFSVALHALYMHVHLTVVCVCFCWTLRTMP